MNNTNKTGCGSPEHVTHRRAFLRGIVAGGTAVSFGGVGLAADVPAADELRSAGKRALFIWLAGGASQFEMWDPKASLETGGPFRTIPTAVPGYHVCELMPNLATLMQKIAVVRSLNTEITAHGPAADLMSTGRKKEPALQYPEIGVVLSKELAVRDSQLPDYVSMFTFTEGRRRPATGFLGGRHAPLLLEDSLRPRNIDLPAGLTDSQHRQREHLRELLSSRFAQRRAGEEKVKGYNSAYAKVRGLMRSDHLFDLSKEPQQMRDRYGDSPFGEQCLLARRLLDAGVPMVKVAHGFWDSHHDNFESHRELVPNFDHVMGVLLTDLAERGLLDSTLVIVLSEFGRTPKINKDVGRDHYAAAWSSALAGAGVQGGSVFGRTDKHGKTVVEGEVSAGDLTATILKAAGINLKKHYYVGPRPVPLAPDFSKPIDAILT